MTLNELQRIKERLEIEFGHEFFIVFDAGQPHLV